MDDVLVGKGRLEHEGGGSERVCSFMVS